MILFRLKKYIRNDGRINFLDNFCNVTNRYDYLYRIYFDKNNENVDNCLYNSSTNHIMEYNYGKKDLQLFITHFHGDFKTCTLYYKKSNKMNICIKLNQNLEYVISVVKMRTLHDEKTISTLKRIIQF